MTESAAVLNFFQLETARRLLYAVRLIEISRALTRLEALQKLACVPLDVSPPITSFYFVARRNIHQVLYDYSSQQLPDIGGITRFGIFNTLS